MEEVILYPQSGHRPDLASRQYMHLREPCRRVGAAVADIPSVWPLRRLNTYTDDAPSLRRARPSQPLFPRSPTNRIRRAVACGSVIGFRYSASTEKLVYVCSNSKMVAATHNADDVKVFSWDNEMFSHLPAVGNV